MNGKILYVSRKIVMVYAKVTVKITRIEYLQRRIFKLCRPSKGFHFITA